MNFKEHVMFTMDFPKITDRVFVGMPKHLTELKVSIGGYVLNQQDWSPMLKILECAGRAKRVGKITNATIWEVKLEGDLSFETSP